MWLTHRGRRCIQLDDSVFQRLLTFYPEEDLLSRPVLASAWDKGEIAKSHLISEAKKLFIPWQMFLLTPKNLKKHFSRIERERRDKIDVGEISTRSGSKGPPPYRLIDRYIRAQRFLIESTPLKSNAYCASLRGNSIATAVQAIETHFGIDRAVLWRKRNKQDAFEYLVGKVEKGGVNVAIGTSEPRLVPTTRNHRALYRNVSGFCLKSANAPFAFVQMNMADEEEPAGRRVYTLMMLVVLIGLDIFTVTRNWRPGQTRKSGEAEYLPKVHAIVCEFLLPRSALAKLRGETITQATVKELSDHYKLTPSAVTYLLLKERIITRDERAALLVPGPLPTAKPRIAHIDNAVRKLNGGLVFQAVNQAVAQNKITPNQAQYVLFGRVNRPLWMKYRARVGL